MKKIYNELKRYGVSIKGMWQDFAISFCKDLGDDFEVIEGMVCFDNGKLLLAQTEDAEDQIDTLIHEVLHIILDGAYLGAEEEIDGKHSLSNEELVRQITPSMVHFLRNNKKFLAVVLKSF